MCTSEYNHVGPCFQSLSEHIKVFYLYLNLANKGCVFLSHTDGFLYRACGTDMIIFEKHTVTEVITVIVTAANGYGIFFEYTHTGSGFSCIKKLGFGAFE